MNFLCRSIALFCVVFTIGWFCTPSTSAEDFKIKLDVISSGFDKITCWVHPRAGVIPAQHEKNKLPSVVLTMNKLQLTGSDVYFKINDMRTDDLGKTWAGPTPHQKTMGRRNEPNNVIVSICDFTPAWHAKTKTLLGTGHSVRYRNEKVIKVRRRESTYSVYDPEKRTWANWKTIKMPKDVEFRNCGSGSTQRYDLPNGDILLPVYFRKMEEKFYKTTVLLCRFDGKTLKYIKHGTELSLRSGNGFCEPSITKFGGRFYLSIRSMDTAYVTSSKDGLNFDKPIKWCFDDGKDLGSYNTQQHWVTHSDGLYLVYTRKGANNDHVMRHRAPLFIAKVDPKTMRVIRKTEKVLVPNKGARLGNFGTVNISPNETWVTTAEWMQTKSPNNRDYRIPMKYGSNNRVYVSRILWNKPNKLVNAASKK